MAEVDQGVEQQEPAGGAPPPPPERESPQREGRGSGRSDIRKELEKGFEEQRKAQVPTGREQREDKGRDRRTGQYTSRARQEADEPEGAPAEGAEAPEAQEAPETAAPEAWSREAKEVWADLPPQVQQAVLKRETDTAKGVEALKNQYKDIDGALASRQELIRNTGHTPAQAVNQLFLWFEALTADVERVKRGIPAQAFPALAQSFGLDPRIAYAAYAQQAQPQQAQTQQRPAAQGDGAAAPAAPEIPPQLQEWWQGQLQQLGSVLGQRFGSIEQQMQQQGLSKANEVLDIWSKGKPHFDEVRMTMAQLLQSGMVPALPNGNADLDKAYDMALYALPEVRAKVLADANKAAETQRKAKEAAERKAQQEQADKARRAAVALSPSAPGAQPQPERKKGKSVRESLSEAMEELSGARR